MMIHIEILLRRAFAYPGLSLGFLLFLFLLFLPIFPGTAAVLDTGIIRITVETDPLQIRFSDQLGEDFLTTTLPDDIDPRYRGVVISPRPGEKDYEFLYTGYSWDSFQDEEDRQWFQCETAEFTEMEPELWEIECVTNDPGTTVTVRIEVLQLDIFRIKVSPVTSREIDRLSLAFRSTGSEHFFGLGERFQGVDLKGRDLSCWSEEGSFGLGDSGEGYAPFPGGEESTNWPVPFFVSSRGYGLLLVTGYRTNYELTSLRSDAFRVEVEGPELDVILFYGPDPQGILSDYTLYAGGRPPLPPKWVFSPWIDAVGGETAVRRRMSALRAHHIPSSVIWTEDWAFPMGSYSVNRDYYPNLETLIEEAHQRGFKFLTYYRPYLIEGTPEFGTGVDQGWVVQDGGGEPLVFLLNFQKVAQVDFTDSQAKAWYQSLLRRGIELGFDGWMFDYGEYTPSRARFSDGRDGREMHNLYPVLAQAAVREILDSERSDGDYVFFCRSGYFGSQSLVGVSWPGDQNTSWEKYDGLPAVIPAGLSLGFSGVALFGSDIAGYLSLFTPPSDRELFFRWVQLGALSPVMRTHHGRPGGNWSFDTDTETLDLFLQYARLHIRLFPYIFSYAAKASDTGVPVMRHLFLHYPSNPDVYGLDYQYLLGEELLVAPVIEEGAREREMYLPHGTWYDFWTDEMYEGPGWETVPAPLRRIPLFVRGGAIIPVLFPDIETLAEPEESGAAGFNDDALMVWIYPSGESSFTMEDGTRLAFVDQREKRDRLPDGFKLSNPGVAVPEISKPEIFSDSELGWRYDAPSSRLSVRVKTPGDIKLTAFLKKEDGRETIDLMYLFINDAPLERQYEFSIYYPLPSVEGCGTFRYTPATPGEIWGSLGGVIFLIFVGVWMRWRRKVDGKFQPRRGIAFFRGDVQRVNAGRRMECRHRR